MSALVIDLTGRRIDIATDRVAKECPTFDERECRSIATREILGPLPRPQIAQDELEPIFELFDAYKAAQAEYQRAMAALARRHGRTVSSMAKVVQSERRRK